MYVLLILLGSTFPEDFTCTQSGLGRALPHLKKLVSDSSYTKLTALHKKLLNDAASKDNISITSKELGRLVSDCLNSDDEKAVCFAALKIEYGYLSLTDKHISKYLQLDAVQREKLREINQKVLLDISQSINVKYGPTSTEEFQKIYDMSLNKYKSLESKLKAEMSHHQKALFDHLYSGYEHTNAVRSLTLRLIREQKMAKQTATVYESAHPNMQTYMRAEGLILMDHQSARSFLELSKVQDEKIMELYSSYADAVDEMQWSLAASINASSVEAIRFHQNAAHSLSEEYSKRFLSILDAQQKNRVTQLMAQVMGYKFCFSLPMQEQLGITVEQNKMLKTVVVKRLREFPESMVGAELDYDKQYRQDRFLSAIVRDEVLTEEQLKKWNTVIGKEIPEEEITKLGKAYVQRTAFWVKARKIDEKK